MRPIYNEPVVYKNFITNGECEYIKRKAMSRLKRSTVSEDYTIDDKIRKTLLIKIHSIYIYLVNKTKFFKKIK